MPETASATPTLATTRPRGRPRALDSLETQRAILAGIAVGLFLKTAVEAAGIAESTFYAWAARWRSGEPEAATLDRFFRSLEKEAACSEARALAAIRNATDDSWRASAFFLSRRHPQRWGLARIRRRRPAPADLSGLTDRELDELAAALTTARSPRNLKAERTFAGLTTP